MIPYSTATDDYASDVDKAYKIVHTIYKYFKTNFVAFPPLCDSFQMCKERRNTIQLALLSYIEDVNIIFYEKNSIPSFGIFRYSFPPFTAIPKCSSSVASVFEPVLFSFVYQFAHVFLPADWLPCRMLSWIPSSSSTVCDASA